MAWNKFRSLLFALTDKFQKLEIQKDILECCVFPILLYDVRVRSLKEKENKIL